MFSCSGIAALCPILQYQNEEIELFPLSNKYSCTCKKILVCNQSFCLIGESLSVINILV